MSLTLPGHRRSVRRTPPTTTANAMLAARGLDDFVANAEDITDPTERAAKAASIAKDEGLCEFARREGHPGEFFKTN